MHEQLGNAAIGFIVRKNRIIDRLIILHLGKERQRVGVIVETDAAIQMRDRRYAQAAPKVLEILAVGDVTHVDLITPVVGEKPPMPEAKEAARLVRHVVAGQVIRVDIARHRLGQIAKLVLNLQAAIGYQARRECRVVVRGDIPVERSTRISLPPRLVVPISGVRTPVLRASPIGNDRYGA